MINKFACFSEIVKKIKIKSFLLRLQLILTDRLGEEVSEKYIFILEKVSTASDFADFIQVVLDDDIDELIYLVDAYTEKEGNPWQSLQFTE